MKRVGIFHGDGGRGGEIVIRDVPDEVSVKDAVSTLIWMGSEEFAQLAERPGLRAAVVPENWPARYHYTYIAGDYAELVEP